VLVGNTVQGNSTMRVAPPGFDTTGDGQNIFGNEKKKSSFSLTSDFDFFSLQ